MATAINLSYQFTRSYNGPIEPIYLQPNVDTIISTLKTTRNCYKGQLFYVSGETDTEKNGLYITTTGYKKVNPLVEKIGNGGNFSISATTYDAALSAATDENKGQIVSVSAETYSYDDGVGGKTYTTDVTSIPEGVSYETHPAGDYMVIGSNYVSENTLQEMISALYWETDEE